MKTFNKSFTQQEPIPEAGITAAIQQMQHGRLHRYNTLPNEYSEVDQLEIEFADYMGLPYCLACSSGGYALHIALCAAGVQAGDKVLCNAFTLAPVAGAIYNSGGVPVFVEVDEHYRIDLSHLEQQAKTSKARYLLLSHMRGHIADMDRIKALCEQYQLFLIEDCAHTMGAAWDGKKSGSFGDIACFSTQTYKHLNSGEGGLLTTQHAEVMAKAIIYSGSYMLFEQHPLAPPIEAFENICLTTPNFSGRMDTLRAAILRPQLASLDQQCQRWNEGYAAVEQVLQQAQHITLPQRPEREQFVASSIQFSLPAFTEIQIQQMVIECERQGVILKWFGDANPKGYTSRYDSWQYLDNLPDLLQTQAVLAKLLDMRLPLTFTIEDCQLVAEIIVQVTQQVA